MQLPQSFNQTLIEQLSREHGLPLHVIFPSVFAENANAFKETANKLYQNTMVCFAAKSNPCRGALRTASKLNLGADVTSEWELRTSYEEGIPPQKIICNGNAKSDDYIAEAVHARAIIAADTIEELDLIDPVAEAVGKHASVLLRFSGMPLDDLTAADLTTASEWTKFGIPISQANQAFQRSLEMKNIDIIGISAHIGTQICDPAGFDLLMDNMIALACLATNRGLNIRFLNIGGGFPLSYLSESKWNVFRLRLVNQLQGTLPVEEWVTWNNNPMGYGYLFQKNVKSETVPSGFPQRPGFNLIPKDPIWRGKAFWSEFPGAKMLDRLLSHKTEDDLTVAEQLESIGSPTLIIEPGRSLIGTAGVTIAKVSGVKTVQGIPVVSLELGIVNHGTNLVTEDIYPVSVIPEMSSDQSVDVFLAGQLCFSGDMISKVRVELNRMPKRGDLIVIHHTGAYCADHFASNCCGFPRPAKIALNEDGSVQVWRQADNFKTVFEYI